MHTYTHTHTHTHTPNMHTPNMHTPNMHTPNMHTPNMHTPLSGFNKTGTRENESYILFSGKLSPDKLANVAKRSN